MTERGACIHADNPKACYRVRCQLGNKCVDDDMSPRGEDANRSTGICFFCSEPINGPHEADCPQANTAPGAPDRHAILYEAGEALLAADHGEAYEVLYRMMEKCRPIAQPLEQTRALTDDARDAARYRYLQGFVFADRGRRGPAYFGLPLPRPVSDPMRGSVAEHFDAAIDAALANQQAQEG